MTKARITIVLNASGMPCVELPASAGAQREVPLYDLQALVAILEAQQAGQQAIATAGAPTLSQAWHDAKHRFMASDKCAFCRSAVAIADADQITENAKQLARGLRPLQRFVADGGVVVRKVPLGQTGIAPQAKAKAAPQPPLHFDKRQTQAWHADRARSAAKAKRDLEDLFA